jgi:hypothetical protein
MKQALLYTLHTKLLIGAFWSLYWKLSTATLNVCVPLSFRHSAKYITISDIKMSLMKKWLKNGTKYNLFSVNVIENRQFVYCHGVMMNN